MLKESIRAKMMESAVRKSRNGSIRVASKTGCPRITLMPSPAPAPSAIRPRAACAERACFTILAIQPGVPKRPETYLPGPILNILKSAPVTSPMKSIQKRVPVMIPFPR